MKMNLRTTDTTEVITVRDHYAEVAARLLGANNYQPPAEIARRLFELVGALLAERERTP